MTPRQPTTAQDGPNAPQTVDTMPGAELDLVAIEDQPLPRAEARNWAKWIIKPIEGLTPFEGRHRRVGYSQRLARTLLDALDEIDHLKAELAQAGKGYTCACCNQWQPDGVGHRCGEGKEGVGKD